jgi:hypothetical protein
MFLTQTYGAGSEVSPQIININQYDKEKNTKILTAFGDQNNFQTSLIR